MKLHPRCVLFDLDGTLVDTAPDLGGAANHVRDTLGMAPLPLADYRTSASGGARGLLKVALGMSPDHADYAARKDTFLEHYRAHLADRSGLFPGVGEMLEGLERQGILWGIVTNKVGCLTDPLIEALGLRKRAACVVSGDCTPNPKPAPDPVLLGAQRAGVAARDCLYAGDDLRDIQAGHAAGMVTIATAWGYMGNTPDPVQWQADVIVDTPAELMGLIELRRAA